MELTDFQLWLKKNHQTLRAYAPDQIAYFAMLNGFPLQTICGDVTNHVVHLKRLMTFWESPLNYKWLTLVSYDKGNTSEDH